MAEKTFDVAMVGPFPEEPAYIKGGIQASVYGLCRALLSQSEVGRVIGISIPLAAERKKRVSAYAVGGVEVTFLTAPYRFLASCVIHLGLTIRLIKALRSPVAHVHGTGVFQAALCICLRIKHIPFVWTLHGITEKETYQRYKQNRTMANAARYALYTLMERITLGISPNIFVDTPYVEKEIRTHNRVHVLPIGIFTQEFAAFSGRERTAPVVISLGVMDPRKGHHVTLKAFAVVKAAIPDAALIIAGSLTDSAYLAALKALALKLNISEAVEFAVECPRREIIEKIGAARVFALHSQEESQGIALCEALAAGLPVVATRVGGIPYVITEGHDGFLIAYGDMVGFADAIIRLLTDDALFSQMSRYAVQSSIRFDWKTIGKEVVKVYLQAAGTITS